MRVAGYALAALLVAAVVPLRRRLGWPAALAALVAAAAVVVVASGLLPHPPDPKKLIRDTAQALGPWSYLLVGTLAFLETGAFVGLVVPGETVVIVGGVIAGQGEIDLLLLIGVTWFAAIAGDSVSFLLGRKLGRPFALKHGGRFRITEERLEQVERYFDRHGGKTILIGRWIGVVRALAPFIAGSSQLPYSRFIPYSVIGTGIWSTTFCVLGFVFWHSFDTIASLASRATAAFGMLVALVVATIVAYRLLRQEERRQRLLLALARASARPYAGAPLRVAARLWVRVLLPSGRVLAPRVRFLVDRLTPGDLGLEFTTPVAIAGAGAYVLTLEATRVAATPGASRLDELAAEAAADLHSALLVDVAKVVTDLGGPTIVLGLLAFAVVLLVARRRWADAAALVLAAVVLVVAVDLLKDAIARPRPLGGHDAVEGSAFPSGHAAYATAWVAVAVVAARAVPGLAHGAALVASGVAICVVVGLTRIYLGVHYLSDVVAGWALGATAFGGVAAVFVLASHLRTRRGALGVAGGARASETGSSTGKQPVVDSGPPPTPAAESSPPASARAPR